MTYKIIEKYVIERTAPIFLSADSKEEFMELYQKGKYDKPITRDENPQVNSILIIPADKCDRYSDDYDDGGDDWDEW